MEDTARRNKLASDMTRATIAGLAIVLGLTAAVLFVAGLSTGHESRRITLWSIAVPCFVVAAGLTQVYWSLTVEHARSRPAGEEKADDNHLGIEAESAASEPLSQIPDPPVLFAAEASVIALGVVSPDQVVNRLVESIRPRTRAFTHSASKTFVELPAEVRYVPVAVSRKGILHDRIDIVNGDGNSLPLLSHANSAALSIRTIRMLLATGVDSEQLHTYIAEIEPRIHQIITSRTPRGAANPTFEAELSAIEAEVRQLYVPTPEKRSDANACYLIAMQMIRLLSVNYVLMAHVDSGGVPRRHIVKMEQFKVPAILLEQSKSRMSGFLIAVRDKLRRAFGVRPTRFVIDLSGARTAGSYHFDLMGPDGTYLGRQEPLGFSTEEVRESGAYIRFRRRLGQRYAHVYARGGRRILRHATSMAVDLTYFERPPGSFAPAALAALALSWFILIGGHATSIDDPGNADVIAVMLTLPGIVAAWFGFEDSRRFLGGSLGSRLHSTLVAALALIASGVFVGDLSWSTDLNLWDLDTGWTLMLIASTALSVTSSFGFFMRARIYRERLNTVPDYDDGLFSDLTRWETSTKPPAAVSYQPEPSTWDHVKNHATAAVHKLKGFWDGS